jgi:translation initiation factor IF-1
MSKNSELIELTGIVDEVLPNTTFRVKVDNVGQMVLCYIGGRLKQHKIKIILGDKVKIEMSPYDLTKGRITYRM